VVRLALPLIPAAMLIVAIGDWPYGYYQFLRLVVCASAVALSVIEFKGGGSSTCWIFVFAGVTLLFNPLATVHFERQIWQALDLGVAAVFLIYAAISLRKYGD